MALHPAVLRPKKVAIRSIRIISDVDRDTNCPHHHRLPHFVGYSVAAGYSNYEYDSKPPCRRPNRDPIQEVVSHYCAFAVDVGRDNRVQREMHFANGVHGDGVIDDALTMKDGPFDSVSSWNSFVNI